CPDPHVEDSLFRLAGVAGAMRFVGDTDDLVALPGPIGPDQEARGELVRRYLRCHGPSTAVTFADWAGISAGDTRRSFAALGDDAVAAGTGLLLRADVDRARDAACAGIRFLPPYDPYLLDRDRATLVPDRTAQRLLWRPAANPGVVLVDGMPVVAWRTKTQAGRRTVDLQPLAGAPAVDLELLHKEASVVLGTATPAGAR
ncbi:MAG TPA: crosslink repair DNA glycosylase YcaQ family protein, partial [Acidimicrobiales bacterium]|nr:crosslink repair DNA glycosylase YcaQ family protein [Acidimicrobiales bacterium]